MSQTTVPVKSYDFAPTKQNITFEAPSFNSNGYGSVKVNYVDSQICIQTHKVKTPFGFSRGIPNTTSYGRDFHLNINMENMSNKGKAFYTSMENLEKLIVDEAYSNRLEWGLYNSNTEAENASYEDVKSKFSPIMRQPKSGSNFPATMRVSFKSKKNMQTQTYHIQSDCYDPKGNPLEPSESNIPRRSQLIVIMFARSLWLSPQGRYGLKWEISQVKVYPSEEAVDDAPVLPKGQLLLLDDSSDEEESE